MKNRNFTTKYTDHKTINSNNYAKFEVNWQMGSQFTARYTKNCLKIKYNLMNKFPQLWNENSKFHHKVYRP